MRPHLVANPLQAGIRSAVVFIAVHDQARWFGNHDQLVGFNQDGEGTIFRHRVS